MLLTTGFVNEDGTVAVVVMNPTARGAHYHLRVGASSVGVELRPRSIQTVVFSAVTATQSTWLRRNDDGLRLMPRYDGRPRGRHLRA